MGAHPSHSVSQTQRCLPLHFSSSDQCAVKTYRWCGFNLRFLYMSESNAVSRVDQPFGCPPPWTVWSSVLPVFLSACLFLIELEWFFIYDW